MGQTANITGGGVDYLIANAALLPGWSGFDPIGDLYDSSSLKGVSAYLH
jgi:hypothetical protein